MKDGLRFDNIVEWKKYDAVGELVDSGIHHNQVQKLAMQRVMTAFDTGSLSAISHMALGTGTGQDTAAAALAASIPSVEVAVTTIGGTDNCSLACVSTFTAITGTVTEAGLFDAVGCTDDMHFYDDSLSVALTSSDSLQITWTISCATCP